jgi:hypothetical protein
MSAPHPDACDARVGRLGHRTLSGASNDPTFPLPRSAQGRAMREPPKRRRRRPTLSAALKAAAKAGRKVKSAVVEDGRVTIVFDDGESRTGASNEWDEALSRGKH